MRPGDLPRVGVLLDSRTPVVRGSAMSELLDLARTVDAMECFDSLWVADSVTVSRRPESMTLLAAVAAVTSRVRLGHACLGSFVLRHPLLVANQMATISALSDRRAALVVCLGGGRSDVTGPVAREAAAFGVEPGSRTSRLEEGIAVVRAAWSGEPVHHAGAFYEIDGLQVEPVPREAIPVWIATNPHLFARDEVAVLRSHDRVARLADGWMTAFIRPAELAHGIAHLGSALAAKGRPSLPVTVVQNVNVGSDAAVALERSRVIMEEHYDRTYDDEAMLRRGMYGSATRVLDWLAELAADGADRVVLSITDADQRTQLERLGELLAV